MAAREALKSFFHTEDSMRALPFGRQLKDIQSNIVKLEDKQNIPISEWTAEKFTTVAS